MRKLATLAAVAVLGGCAGLGTGDFASKGEAILTAEPRPVLAGLEGDDEAFLKWGARGGVVMSFTSEKDMSPRLAVGGYARFLESEARRLEVGFEVVPDIENMDRTNMYVSFAADYVGFIGEGGLYWKAGGGGILDLQDDKMFFLLLMEVGAGWWFSVGEEGAAVVANVMLQRPEIATPDSENNAEMMLSITAGYEF